MSDLLVTKSEKELLATKGFKLFKLLNFGTDSKIYLSRFEDSVTKKRYYLACKVYDTRKMHKKFLQKFLPREINTLLNISHPNIVQIHCIFKWRTKFYIFMRYAERGDLFDYIKYNGKVDEKQARLWFKQMCLAIKYIHDLDIAHRDLKCENILLTRNYNVKIADFGFSRSCLNAKGEVALCETYCGSISYTAPEIIKGTPYRAKPADLWSLGVILYIMNNRSMPFYDENIVKLYAAQMNQKWRFKAKYEKEMSEPVKILIRQLLDPHPATRLNIEQVLASSWFAETSEAEKETTDQSMPHQSTYIVSKIFFNDKDPRLKALKSHETLMIKEIVPITRSDETLQTEEEQMDPSEADDMKEDEKSSCCVIL